MSSQTLKYRRVTHHLTTVGAEDIRPAVWSFVSLQRVNDAFIVGESDASAMPAAGERRVELTPPSALEAE